MAGTVSLVLEEQVQAGLHLSEHHLRLLTSLKVNLRVVFLISCLTGCGYFFLFHFVYALMIVDVWGTL